MNKYINNRPVGGNYFFIQKRTGGNDLHFYLDQFNINDYYILKYSARQKWVDINEFLDFKNSGYLFFRKDKYDIDHMNMWIDFYRKTGRVAYYIKPMPPFSPNKIIIKK